MEKWLKAVNEQTQKFQYLEDKKEKNWMIIQNRVREIEEEKQIKKIPPPKN